MYMKKEKGKKKSNCRGENSISLWVDIWEELDLDPNPIYDTKSSKENSSISNLQLFFFSKQNLNIFDLEF